MNSIHSNPWARRKRQWAGAVGLVLLAAGALFSGCGEPRQQLHVFTWPDYIDPVVIAGFEKEFNCKVTLDYYEDVTVMVSKMAAGGASTYDIFMPGHWSLPGLIQNGLVAPLRHENIPNLKNIDPQFLNPGFDPENRHSVPYFWGTTGVYIRAPQGQQVDETWALVFDPARQPGPFLLLEDIRHTIGAALRYQGHDPNTIDPKQLAAARDLVLGAKERSLGFATSFAAKNRILTGEAVMAIAYNGDALRGVAEDPATRYFLPREGASIWVDCLSIPARAPHRDLAEKFINYLLDPKVAASNANFTRAATPNRAALELIDPAVRANPGIYPGPEVFGRLKYDNHQGPNERLYDELWTQIKSK